MNRLNKGITAILIIMLIVTGCNTDNGNTENNSSESNNTSIESGNKTGSNNTETENGDKVKEQIEDDVKTSMYGFETDKITVLRCKDDALQDNELEVVFNIEDKDSIEKIINTLQSEEWEEVSLEKEIAAVPEYYISFNNGTLIKLLSDISYGLIMNYTIDNELYEYTNGNTYYFPDEFLNLIIEEANKSLITTTDVESETLYPLINDNINELNNTVLGEIVQSYFLVFDFDMSFNEHDFVNYERAFQYMRSAGTYPIQPFEYWKLFENYYDSELGNYTIPVEIIDELILENKVNASCFTELSIIDDTYIVEPSDVTVGWSVRSELYQYFNKDTEMITVPTNIVDEYILNKFNTTIDYSQIKEYAEDGDTYTYYPFLGDFYYDISIDEVIIDDEIVTFTGTLTDNIEDSPTSAHQATFVIKFVHGEYKFLSVEIKEINVLSIENELPDQESLESNI